MSLCADNGAPDTPLATSHGDATSTATPKLTAAHSHRGLPLPGTTAHTRATVAASISPVGVSPASAMKNTTGHQDPSGPRSRSIVAATHGRHPYPTSRLQCPCKSRSAT